MRRMMRRRRRRRMLPPLSLLPVLLSAITATRSLADSKLYWT